MRNAVAERVASNSVVFEEMFASKESVAVAEKAVGNWRPVVERVASN